MSLPPQEPKASRARIDAKGRRERSREIERLWLSGTPEGTIREWLRQTYEIKTSFAKKLIKRVKERVAAADPTDPNSARARAVQMLLDTYAMAAQRQRARGLSGLMPDPDTRTMAAVVKTLSELEGAKKPEQIEHSFKVDFDSVLRDIAAAKGSGNADPGTVRVPSQEDAASDSGAGGERT